MRVSGLGLQAISSLYSAEFALLSFGIGKLACLWAQKISWFNKAKRGSAFVLGILGFALFRELGAGAWEFERTLLGSAFFRCCC